MRACLAKVGKRGVPERSFKNVRLPVNPLVIEPVVPAADSRERVPITDDQSIQGGNLYSVASEPNGTVHWLDSTPPLPCAPERGAGIGGTRSRGPACGDATVQPIMSASQLPILC